MESSTSSRVSKRSATPSKGGEYFFDINKQNQKGRQAGRQAFICVVFLSFTQQEDKGDFFAFDTLGLLLLIMFVVVDLREKAEKRQSEIISHHGLLALSLSLRRQMPLPPKRRLKQPKRPKRPRAKPVARRLSMRKQPRQSKHPKASKRTRKGECVRVCVERERTTTVKPYAFASARIISKYLMP